MWRAIEWASGTVGGWAGRFQDAVERDGWHSGMQSVERVGCGVGGLVAGRSGERVSE